MGWGGFVNTIGVKRCSGCKTSKSCSDFSPTRRHRDGLAGWCKSCKAKMEKARRAKPRVIALHRMNYQTDMNFRARQLLGSVAKRCRSGGIEFDLDVEWLTGRLTIGRCEVTGLKFDMARASRLPTAYAPSIDRVNAGGPYTKANCRVVLYALNIALNRFGLESFMPIAEALARGRERQAA